MGATALFVPVAVLYVIKINKKPEVDSSEGNSSEGNKSDESFLPQVSLALAAITAIHHLFHSAYLGWPSFRALADRRHWLLASSLYAEMRLKGSAAHKLNKLIENALDIFKKANDGTFAGGTQYSMALQSYAKHGKVSKEVGGLIWAWKRLFGYEEANLRDGIWISTRLLASNLSQYIVTIYLFIVGINKIFTINDDFSLDKATEHVEHFTNAILESSSADSVLISETVGNVTSTVRELYKMQAASGVDFGCDGASGNAEQILKDFCTNSTNDPPFNLVCEQNADINYICPFLTEDLTVSEQYALLMGNGGNDTVFMKSLATIVNRATEDAIQAIYPSKPHMLTVPVAVATIAAFLTAGYLAVSYIPSVMYTTLKLRTGVIRTLKDPRFYKYRETPDLVAILTG
jgi:hypothetical protein